jgi:uncharacterized membrane protein
MRNFLSFIKTTALGGLVVIVPLAILIIVLLQVFNFLKSVTEALTKILPFVFLEQPVVMFILVFSALIGICFVTGLLLRTNTGSAIKQRIDGWLDDKVPMYGVIRSITAHFAGIDEAQLTPAEIDLHGNTTRVLGFVIEQLPDGRQCVYVPDSPILTVGSTYIVEEHQISRLPGAARAAADAITQWGAGTRQLYSKSHGTTEGSHE